MNITLKATRLTLTPSLKTYAEEKLEPLERHFGDIQLVKMELERLTDRTSDAKFRAEVTLDAPHGVFRAESRQTDLYAAIDTVVPKLLTQIEKFKHKKVAKLKIVRRKIKEGNLLTD